MEHFQDFSRSGHSFEERIGEPTEVDAAIGRIAPGFSFLEDMVRGMVQIFMGGEPRVAQIADEELT